MKPKESSINVLGDLMAWGYAQLADAELDADPRLDADVIMSELLQKDRSYLFAHPETILHFETVQRFQKQIKQRKKGEPVAYVTGLRHFWDMKLHISQQTLIPRPETEHLVELALKLDKGTTFHVLDLGTGSGTIALALGKSCPHWQITACDKYENSIELAQLNAEVHNINNVQFLQSDWFENIQGEFDLIVSNPPYVAQKDPHLKQGDVRFEPKRALTSGSDGLKDIRQIIAQAKDYLVPGGHLYFEHGAEQKADCQAILADKNYQAIFTLKDLAGLDRISGGRYG
jgi:release factor glutamine methyltransferase